MMTKDRGLPLSGDKPQYSFELYMMGTTPSSSRAVVNLRRLCEERLSGRYDISVIDVSVDRVAARDANIIAAPTLVLRSPLPERRFIGDLSDEARLIERLDI